MSPDNSCPSHYYVALDSSYTYWPAHVWNPASADFLSAGGNGRPARNRRRKPVFR